MGLFERYLTVWVALGILAGVALGLAAPGAFQLIAALEIAHVNLVVAVFIWIMIYPMMIQIDWHAVRDVRRTSRGLMLTLVAIVNRTRRWYGRAAAPVSAGFGEEVARP